MYKIEIQKTIMGIVSNKTVPTEFYDEFNAIGEAVRIINEIRLKNDNISAIQTLRHANGDLCFHFYDMRDTRIVSMYYVTITNK